MKIRKIAFTGSTLTGHAILKALAESSLKKVSLSLGGKSPTIIFGDANLEETATWAAIGITAGEGDICTAGSQIHVQDTVYGRSLEAFSNRYKSLAPSDTMALGTNKGSFISDQKQIGNSNAIETAAFFDVPEDSAIMKEEIFGPVASIAKFREEEEEEKEEEEEEESIQKANNTEYGSSAAISIQGLVRAHRFVDRLDSGQVTINAWSLLIANLPFGGTKQSGFGRDDGL
ncbi:hypothetical protein COCMIDRAFT_32888 [Bipolaris oryzae ATCC 44560]|uniref:aldehyde dehydrogenase (NAD(+)) n=1 Tax=Bipolaris oryzae ATCC 44560 TaxID=930090 RepID=W7A0U0_COCMI|nr:uncharacterized protein COCMIDRAFT_32888 [Bipolaris oryzae ATCC 44560]EUC49661.1 hypothetical protein COCMIDRAFT_32888 [Bipolaris oryzae ATCC 44560]